MLKIFTLFILFLIALPVKAEIIFEDNFDNRQDWSSSVTTGVAETWPATMQTIINGPSTVNSTPTWYSYRSSSLSHLYGDPLYVIDSQDGHGGVGKSLRYNIERNSYMNGGGLDLVLCNTATCGWDEINIRFYVKFEEDFDFPDGGGDFIKLFRLYTGVDVQNDTMGPSSTYATQDDYVANPQIKRSMLGIAEIVADGNADYRLSFAYFLGQIAGVDYLENQNTPSPSVFNLKNHLGEWIYYELDARLNIVDQSDGAIKIWAIPENNINSYDINTPTFVWEGLKIRNTAGRKWNTIILADNMSGQWERDVNEQTIAWDDLVVSTEHIGPIDVGVEDEEIRADVNQDQQINITDTMLTLRNSLGLSMTGTAWVDSSTTGDVNCDGVSNSIDAMLLLRYSLELPTDGTGWCIS